MKQRTKNNKELTGIMEIYAKIEASTFSLDNEKIHTSSGHGKVYFWDVHAKKWLHGFSDEGGMYRLSIATCRNGHLWHMILIV